VSAPGEAGVNGQLGRHALDEEPVGAVALSERFLSTDHVERSDEGGQQARSGMIAEGK
jgi:hypothetical protein